MNTNFSQPHAYCLGPLENWDCRLNSARDVHRISSCYSDWADPRSRQSHWMSEGCLTDVGVVSPHESTERVGRNATSASELVLNRNEPGAIAKHEP